MAGIQMIWPLAASRLTRILRLQMRAGHKKLCAPFTHVKAHVLICQRDIINCCMNASALKGKLSSAYAQMGLGNERVQNRKLKTYICA